ncbi:MAG: SGNH/GDSL hydrolase family protein [Opitutaceae bacterium]|nr:SGNH/GDSL hydrolase family protein [Opitutaceae bacterium]
MSPYRASPMFRLSFLLVVFGILSAISAFAVHVAPNDPHIEWTGAPFAKVSPNLVEFRRFSDDCLANATAFLRESKATTTTGVVIRFTTTSARATANFRVLPGDNRGSWFGIYQNGVRTAEMKVDKSKSTFGLDLVSVAAGSPVTFEIVMPIFSNCALTGLDLSDGTLLRNPKLNRPVYAAMGDSITHGTGQDATWQTYAWIVAQDKGWALENLAVGGSRVTPPIGDDIKGRRIDVISILIGYNDWNMVNDPAVYRANYESLLKNIREHQPRAAILCITPLYSSKSKPSGPGVTETLDPYRDIVRSLVRSHSAQGDDRIFLIEGLSISDAADVSKDGVHLSIPGAARVAERLSRAIEKLDLKLTGQPLARSAAH